MSNLYSLNGEYPTSLPEKIRLKNGMTRTDNSSFTPEELLDAGYTGPYEFPNHDPNFQTVRWDSNLMSFLVENIPDYEIWEDLRIERNRRLTLSDWTQSRDVVLANDQEWKDYRQELRDLPQKFTNPIDTVFPELPPVIY